MFVLISLLRVHNFTFDEYIKAVHIFLPRYPCFLNIACDSQATECHPVFLTNILCRWTICCLFTYCRQSGLLLFKRIFLIWLTQIWWNKASYVEKIKSIIACCAFRQPSLHFFEWEVARQASLFLTRKKCNSDYQRAQLAMIDSLYLDLNWSKALFIIFQYFALIARWSKYHFSDNRIANMWAFSDKR